MKRHAMKFILFIIVASISGCATPKGMEWYKKGASVKTTNADVHDCKVNTFLWWPFDTLYRCMHRRGYVLVGEGEVQKRTQAEEAQRRARAFPARDKERATEEKEISRQIQARKRKVEAAEKALVADFTDEQLQAFIEAEDALESQSPARIQLARNRLSEVLPPEKNTEAVALLNEKADIADDLRGLAQ